MLTTRLTSDDDDDSDTQTGPIKKQEAQLLLR